MVMDQSKIRMELELGSIGSAHQKFDRFDFEQQIMACWSICEALDDIAEGALEHDWNSDKVATVAQGLKEQYQLRFNKLFDMFEAGTKERKVL